MLSADWNDGKKKKKKITICVHRCLSFHLLYARCTSAKQNKKQKSPKSLILRSRQSNWMFDCCFFSCLYLFFLTDVNIWTFFFFSPSFFSGAALLEAHALDVRERVRLSSGGYEWATAARPAGQYGQLMNEVEIIKINRPGDTTQRVPPPCWHIWLCRSAVTHTLSMQRGTNIFSGLQVCWCTLAQIDFIFQNRKVCILPKEEQGLDGGG